jgi:iron complex transport system substrate-binding protein
MNGLQLSTCTAFFIALIGLAPRAQTPQTRTIVDMAGHAVSIPAVISSVYTIGPVGEIVLYTLAPGKLAGKTWKLVAPQTDLLTEEYLKKPLLGGWYGKNTTANPEVIIKAHPDIVLSVEHHDMVSTEPVKEKLGLPVVIADCGLESLDSMYRFIGAVVGERARADTLARYCRATLDSVTSGVARIPDAEKVRVYYAEGTTGLETDPKGTMHTEVIDMAGAQNVADITVERSYGRGTVSFEQLLLWKPEVILVCLDHGYAGGSENYKRITTDPTWATIDAVKNKRIYCIPSVPFNWIDRPPSVNRIIGLKWLANLLYPDRFKMDIREEAKTFYKLFYHRNLTDAELNKVLENATSK